MSNMKDWTSYQSETYNKEKENISFSEHDFESIQLKCTDAVTAFFSIPFCNPDCFDELWNKIYSAINDNGYFVGQLFGDRVYKRVR